MDAGRERWRRWLATWTRRISRSPSPHPSGQPASASTGLSGDRSPNHGTTRRQPSNTRAQAQSTTPLHPQHQPPRTQRHRRSSLSDEVEHRPGFGGERDAPRARRPSGATRSENNWRAPVSGSLPDTTMITRRPSRSRSPQGYHTPQEGPAPRGGEMDDALSAPSRWSPPQDVSIRSASPHFRQPDMRESGDGQDHLLPRPQRWDASQGSKCAYRHPDQEPITEAPSNDPEFSGRAHQEGLPALNHGVTYNIANAGNVFTGINNGIVYMESATAGSANEFMINLANRLKICVRADHMYYASGDEAALRRGQCTEGTRVDIIGGVIYWATNASPGSEIVYWLSGQAGAGKTTIAFTIASHFETLFDDGHGKAILGGSFFCSREFLDTRTASSIVRTIVYQLALRSKPFRAALKEHGRFETVDHGPRSQFMGLLVEPWKMSAPERLAENEPCYILPIDALDELEGAGGTEFLGALFDVVEQQDLSGLKFFVTSRSEPALVRRIESFANKQICRLEEVPLEESSADIKVYLTKALAQCATTQQIQQLVSDAAGLFIYAATVAEFVKGRSLEVQRNLLNRLLSTPSLSPSRPPSPNATATLDRLYLQVLETSLVDPRDRGDPDVFQDCLSILHTFLCTIERTSAAVAVAILNESSSQNEMVIDVSIAEEILHRLHAVLYVQGNLVMSFHKSFADFLFDARRSQRFFCNQEQHHCRLANGCFQIMAMQLRFNIASISSSHQMDSDNPTLAACIDAKISASLKYACVNWSAHLILAPFEALDSLTEMVCQFLQLQNLFWMEVMNLLGQRGRCQDMLRDVQQWFSRSKSPVDLVGQLADAEAFARYHSTSKAALSTPHLYLSSLATFPRHSAMVQNWRQQFGGIPGFTSAHGVGGEAMVVCIPLKDKLRAFAVSPNGAHVALGLGDSSVRIWDLSTGEEVRVLKGHTSKVLGVAYSPDGTHVASGSEDRSIRVWDLATGEEVRVLKGHTNEVNTVAYSPDGTHLVSGSDDKSIRVWDMSTGDQVRLLEGHTSIIMAVACSPDGTHVASASGDNSVCVWDLFKGEQVMVLKGHTQMVWAVAYSPDGTHLVSCSHDQSVWVWDMSTGDGIVLEGHTDAVWSVDYSPDGSHVVSGSEDTTIRVWDLSTGKHVRVIEGHSTVIKAVAYLPDGTHVVSGSGQDSLRVWDLSAEEERSVLKGHTKGVTAVAYSPDGTHVVSGLQDNSIQIWDLSTLEEVGVLIGHTGRVQAVAYLPDGTHLVSGSDDESVRVWDLSTGREVRVFEGHTGWVYAVAYSPGGTHVVSGSEDRSIRVWDLSTGKEVRVLKGHTKDVSTVAYSPSGTHVVSGSWDDSVRVWDTSTGHEVSLFKGHTSSVTTVAYSPDGTHVVSGSWDRSVRVWCLSTGQEVKVLNSHTNWVNALAYSPDGAHLVSGSGDKSLRIWNMATGKQVGTLKVTVHAGGIKSLAYSLDGTHVVFCSRDNSVHVWDIFSEYTPCYVHQEDPDGNCTGWLLSPSDPLAHLMFVRPEARVLTDSNVVTLPTSSVSYVDFSNAKFGNKWTECYTPRSL